MNHRKSRSHSYRQNIFWLIAILTLALLAQFVAPLAGSIQAQEQDPPPTETPAEAPTIDPAAAPAEIPTEEATTDPLLQPTVEVVATPMPTPAPVIQPETSGDPLVHIVAVGESLNSLAAQSGFLVGDLAQRNDLTQPYLLIAGQKVNLPAQVSQHIRLHRVTPGETISGLAAQYNVSPYLLREMNRLACGDCLVIGQMLRVPDQSVGTNLPEPFDRIEISPAMPRQGDVVVVRVTSSTPLDSIVGSLAGRPLRFVPINGVYEALSGVAALQDPGVYAITLRAIAANGAASEVGGRIQVGSGGFGSESLTIAQRLVPLLDPQVNLDERNELDAILSQWSATQWWQGPLQLPVNGKLASYYGARRVFNGGLLYTYHSGTDIVAGVGTPVHAAAPGRVAAVQDFRVRGTVVIIDHGRGVFTLYCHLSAALVKVGQIVDVGEVIARSGNTGRSEGPHLHWELAVGGVTVDALRWVDRAIP